VSSNYEERIALSLFIGRFNLFSVYKSFLHPPVSPALKPYPRENLGGPLELPLILGSQKLRNHGVASNLSVEL
jgi:hypothetical protein